MIVDWGKKQEKC